MCFGPSPFLAIYNRINIVWHHLRWSHFQFRCAEYCWSILSMLRQNTWLFFLFFLFRFIFCFGLISNSIANNLFIPVITTEHWMANGNWSESIFVWIESITEFFALIVTTSNEEATFWKANCKRPMYFLHRVNRWKLFYLEIELFSGL